MNAGGEVEPQGLVPPYGDKEERADSTADPQEVPADSARPADAPPSSGQSPADEQESTPGA